MENNKIEQYRTDFYTLAELLVNNMPKYADHIIGNFTKGLCPSMQFIGLEALKHSDIPHNIPQNGVYIYFTIDFEEKSVEVHSSGHIYLSNEESKATYLAMTDLKQLTKMRGGKWMRKAKFKDINDLYKRISTFYVSVMEIVNEYTQGYPYKQGIGWRDKSLNKN